MFIDFHRFSNDFHRFSYIFYVFSLIFIELRLHFESNLRSSWGPGWSPIWGSYIFIFLRMCSRNNHFLNTNGLQLVLAKPLLTWNGKRVVIKGVLNNLWAISSNFYEISAVLASLNVLELHWTLLSFIELHRASLKFLCASFCSLHWAALSCMELCWAVLSCFDLYWAALSWFIELLWASLSFVDLKCYYYIAIMQLYGPHLGFHGIAMKKVGKTSIRASEK